jgi:non-canonical poly(A) RNA polymerase PAPD5/7
MGTRRKQVLCSGTEYGSRAVAELLEDLDAPLKLSNTEKLDYELLRLYQEVAPDKTELAARRHLYERIERYIQESFPGAEVIPFGSYATTLMVVSSDIDIGIQFPSDGCTGDKAGKYLPMIKAALRRSAFADQQSLLHIRGCRTPIIKFKDRDFGFKVDISISQPNGADTARFISEALRERPYLKVFCVLLKYFLGVRNQGDAASGGLNGYSQFLLMLNFFQLHPLVQQNAIAPLENIGVLFLDFFQYYGCAFPYIQAKVSVNRVGYVENTTRMLSIEDPVDPENDVASACRNSPCILQIFSHAYRVMAEGLASGASPRKSLLSLWFRRRTEERRTRARIVKKYRAVIKRRG